MYKQSSANITHQNGFVLLEALVAILIFSVGVLALVGIQALAAKQSTDAKYRTEAALLANKLIGTMWVDNRTTATLKAKYQTCSTSSCAGYAAWLNEVRNALPGVVANSMTAPTVVISNTGVVTVTVYWRTPSQEANERHSYVAIAQIL
jgi:type IV pilus assembly protein PilV